MYVPDAVLASKRAIDEYQSTMHAITLFCIDFLPVNRSEMHGTTTISILATYSSASDHSEVC